MLQNEIIITNNVVNAFREFVEANKRIFEDHWDDPKLYKCIDRQMMQQLGYSIPQRIAFYAFLSGMEFDYSVFGGRKYLENIDFPEREKVEMNFKELWNQHHNFGRMKTHVAIKTYREGGEWNDEYLEDKPLFPFR